LRITQVFRYRSRPLRAQPEDRANYVPDYTGPDIIGLAAIDLLSWRDVTAEFKTKQNQGTAWDDNQLRVCMRRADLPKRSGKAILISTRRRKNLIIYALRTLFAD